MSFISAFAIYFLIWWLVLFAVLPFGVRSQAEAGDVADGSEPGAPELPKLWRKLGVTTLISCVIFGVLAWIYASGIITIDDLTFLPDY